MRVPLTQFDPWFTLMFLCLITIPDPSTCSYPEARITNLEWTKPAGATRLLRSGSYVVQTSTRINCSVAGDTSFSWSYFKVNSDNKLDSIVPVQDVKGPEWSIPPRSLDIGLYLVQFFVKRKDGIGSGVALGFVEIVPSKLVAAISGGSSVKRGANKPIDLDASPSQDPDVGSGNYAGMAFTWACKKAGEVFSGPLTTLPVVYPPPQGTPGGGGCYGTGIGRIQSTLPTASLAAANMAVGQTYTVALAITKGSRNATTEQMIHLIAGDPPVIYLKWVR